jgi:hypothetical protein
MANRDRGPVEEGDRDLLDAIPGFNRASSSLQRSVGPSCLLSLIISALILIVVRRYVKLPVPGMILLTLLVWWAVLVVLLRLGGRPGDDEY